MWNRTTTLGRLIASLIVGVTSLLVGALIGILTLWWPPSTTVSGTASAADRAVEEPARPAPSTAPPTGSNTPGPTSEPRGEPSKKRAEPVEYGQRPGTVRLPEGGTARLVRAEVGPDAVLPVPENLNEATWWGAGLNAAKGATLMAGHVNWQGRTGPFDELWRVQVGQRVSVRDAEGRDWNYRVSRIVTLDKDELPERADALFGQDGKHRLVLVTCGGRWIGGGTGYASNRVVVAEPIR